MSWITISIEAPEELKDALVGEFSSDRILGVWERPSTEPGSLDLVFFFEPQHVPPLIEARSGRVFERNGYAAPEVKVGTEEKKDWSVLWRKGYTSFPVGRRFQVMPSWESSSGIEKGRIAIEIDPGLAFGTGTHETTQLMLESLEQIESSRGPVLDLGTGSGILAIAAEKIGFRLAGACDVDPDAVRVAAENLCRNGVSAPVFVGSVDAIRTGSVGLVLANLTSDVIEGVLGEIGRVLAPRGRAVFSGILDSQTVSVSSRIREQEFRIENEVHRGEWVAVWACRDGG